MARTTSRRRSRRRQGGGFRCSANPLRDRIQCVQYMYRKLARGGVINFRVRLQRVLDEFYALFIGRDKCRLRNHGFFPVLTANTAKSFESATTQPETVM